MASSLAETNWWVDACPFKPMPGDAWISGFLWALRQMQWWYASVRFAFEIKMKEGIKGLPWRIHSVLGEGKSEVQTLTSLLIQSSRNNMIETWPIPELYWYKPKNYLELCVKYIEKHCLMEAFILHFWLLLLLLLHFFYILQSRTRLFWLGYKYIQKSIFILWIWMDMNEFHIV